MKYLSVALLLVIGIISTAVGQPPAAPANEGSSFGAGTTAEKAIAGDQLPQLVKDKDSAPVKVIAKVLDVCPKKGCWMSLEMPDKTTVFVKMKDYAFFVPLAIIGKTVVIDAEAKTIETSVDELKHYAEDAKKSKEEI